MKKMYWLLILLNLLFCGVVSAEEAAAPVRTIRFATEATYPPFEYMGTTGHIQGFDIDIAKAICSELKAQCTFASQSFNSLITSLNLGKFDALIAALGITPEREKQVSFTQSYYEPSASFIAEKEKHYSLASISGKIIGVQEGSTFAKYLAERYHNQVTVKTYASIEDAFLDLIAGRVEIVLADTPIAKTWLKQPANDEKYTIIEKPIIDHEFFGSGYGIAVRKNNKELLDALNQALTTIKKDGTYDKIVQQYFGAP